MDPFALLLALLLGLKHSMDADHIAAVATYATRSSSSRSALMLGLHWAAGHILTAAALTLLLFHFRDLALGTVLGSGELLVGILLVALGAFALRDVRPGHVHRHAHGGRVHAHRHVHGDGHAHRHLLGIGIIHGLASNDELLILLTLTVGLSSLEGVLAGLAFFSAGVLAGMAAFAALLSVPAVRGGWKVRTALVAGSGVASIGYGLLILAGAV
ncbi:MAG: hypothetical protein HY520_00300 [Candidatus Aenigmarchaeota archaeon]|nr:hypothetical protein [Candidatus Aenigmarchaeota archaeon]